MDSADMLRKAIMIGGRKIGYLTNPETRNRPSYIEVNGEKLVCHAQGGECRFNSKYYTLGMGDTKSWITPIIDETCPNECPYKTLVCDEHPEGECPSSESYVAGNPSNKFEGQFKSYCREFLRLER